ncbi:MAG: macro domain-containing protein [Planctomycetes bacterium]|nr:macro domain-containing protein [Planctomycetota bacterium]
MIRHLEGDILLSEAQYIAHGIAPNDDFKQGLALALREQWPAMYNDFRHHCHQSHPKAGEIWVWGGAGGARIVNLMTQDAAYGKGAKPGKATASHLNKCLRALRKFCDDENVESVALPRIATGVGGMAWEEVEPLIQKHLGDAKTDVRVYTTYHAGQKAAE